MNTRERERTTSRTISAQDLHALTPAQVRVIDEVLASLGAFGEVRIVKCKGRVRFIETLESRDMLKIGNGRGDA